MADYVGWKPALTAALGKVGETLEVEQITLTAPLAYTLPTGLPSGVVHSVVFTQDNTGGHTVTCGGDPVTVDTTAGASTRIELWPVSGGGWIVAEPDAAWWAAWHAMAAGTYLVPDPAHPGGYLMTEGSSLTEHPAYPGGYTIGALA